MSQYELFFQTIKNPLLQLLCKVKKNRKKKGLSWYLRRGHYLIKCINKAVKKSPSCTVSIWKIMIEKHRAWNWIQNFEYFLFFYLWILLRFWTKLSEYFNEWFEVLSIFRATIHAVCDFCVVVFKGEKEIVELCFSFFCRLWPLSPASHFLYLSLSSRLCFHIGTDSLSAL